LNNNGNSGPTGTQPPEEAVNVENGDTPDTSETLGNPDIADLNKAAEEILRNNPEAVPDPSGEDAMDEVSMLKAELSEANERYMRTQAEMENLRKRTERELINRSKFAISKFAESVLSVGDNIQRAIQAVPEDATKDNPALSSLIDGIKVTERELLNILERHDIKLMDVIGVQLDPNYHQAMYEFPNDQVPHGSIQQIVQNGYMIGDRVLRAAQVGVAKGGPRVQPVAASAAGAAAATVPVDAPIEPREPEAAKVDTPVDAPIEPRETDPGVDIGIGIPDRPEPNAANDDRPGGSGQTTPPVDGDPSSENGGDI